MKIFITGAGGFVGDALIQQLLATDDCEVVALSRQSAPDSYSNESQLKWITGDLLDMATCRKALAGCNAIVHLAAVTGKAEPHLYEHVIVEGTKRLLAAARDAGNLPILNVSTIAVKFPELGSYPYAKAKQRAERLVAKSGLDFTTIRPTIVLGPGSGVWGGLRQMAMAPAGIVFGSGNVEIQPIHVNDLVGCLIAVLKENRFRGETLDIGGRHKVSINDFWRAIREDAGCKPGPLLHAPLSLVLPLVQLAEIVAYRFTPLTVGQLSMFRFSSVPEASTFHLKRMPSMMGIEEMIAETRAATPGPKPAPELECEIFCRYLIDKVPSKYVVQRYVAGIESEGFRSADSLAFDDELGRFAAKGPLLTGLVDAYSRFIRPKSIVRRKLVLLLAILESTSFESSVDEADDNGVMGFLTQSTLATLGFMGRFAASVAVFMPLQLLTMVRSGK